MSTAAMHSLLRRQLKRCFGAGFTPPAEWQTFLAAIDAAYSEFDSDRGMLERSLELSSQELLQAGAEMRAVLEALPDLLVRLDADGTILECKMGRGGDARGTVAREAVRTEAAAVHLCPPFRAAVARALETQKLASVEYALSTALGTRHFEARIVPVLERQVAAFVRDISERKRAEEELFSSREMLRTILDTIPQRVFWKNRDGVFLGGNRPFAADLGLDEPAEIAGRSDFETTSRDMAEKYRADDRDIMQRDRPMMDFEEPQLRPDGSMSWLLTSKVPLHDKAGRVIGILGTYEDVTERKQIESLRAGQNRLLEMIVTGSPLAETLAALARLMEVLVADMRCTIMIVEADGRNLRFGVAPSRSEEFARVLANRPIAADGAGCSAAAAQKQVVISADTQSDSAWAPLRAVTEQFGIRACWSAPAISSAGAVLATVAMHFSRPRAPSTGELELLHIAAHIAAIAIERQRAEEALRRSISLFQSTLESTGDGILVVDRGGRIVSFNARFVSLWRLPQELLDRRDDEACLRHVLGQLKDPASFSRSVRELYEQPEAECADVVEFTDGRVFERYSCPQRLDGEPIGRVWNFRDVTQRVRLEEQFRQSHKMEAVGQLAGGVAHDFNNLLTVIIGNLSLINGGGLLPTQQRAGIEDALRSARRAANLTGQLLTFSRRQQIEPKELELNQVVKNLTSMLRRLIGEHIVLETRLAPEGAFVRADPGMMEQALMNLSLNARDAMPRGGRLSLATSVVEITAAMLVTRPRARAGTFVRLAVGDSGTGIAPEHLPRIFEPFFTTKEVGRGTGLGLATVFGIVQQHDGWIEVESAPGKGSTFALFLPRVAGSATSAPATAPAAPSRRGSETILIAEDELEVRVLMQKLLEGHGYRVYAAPNAAEAASLWRAHRHEIALLVTDVVMPGGMNGRELAERLCADQPALRVIYCSGYTDDMLDGTGRLRAHANFLEKPFDVTRFLERVRQTLDGPVLASRGGGG